MAKTKLEEWKIQYCHDNYGRGNGNEFTKEGLAKWFGVSVNTINQVLNYQGAYRIYATEEQLEEVRNRLVNLERDKLASLEAYHKRQKEQGIVKGYVERYFRQVIESKVSYTGTASKGTSTLLLVAVLKNAIIHDIFDWKVNNKLGYAAVQETYREGALLALCKQVIREYPNWASKSCPVIKRSGECYYREQKTAVYCRWQLSEECVDWVKEKLYEESKGCDWRFALVKLY